MLYPMILIGGAGTRLWPLSRASEPKQLLPIASTQFSMFQATLLRLRGLDELAPAIVLCNQEHRFQVADQLLEIDEKARALILEPMARNTCAAVAVAALQLAEDDPEGMMLVLPSDHVIGNVPAFHRAIATAREAARQSRIALFGIVPHKAETGFGYIQKGAAEESGEIHEIARFVEKPDLATAQEYLHSGDFLWNSGMFVARADVLLQEIEKHAPEVLEACRKALKNAARDLDFLRLNVANFGSCPSISMDCAVLEKTARSVVIPVDMGWSDVGSWSALWELGEKDGQGNVREGDVLLSDTHDCFVSSRKRLVTTLGVRDLIVVETGDAVLVAHKDSVQDVKNLVETLQKQKRHETEYHCRVYRPWGSYEGVDREERFQVKRIIVKPGAQLSLQKHFHRAEHWVVVSGTAQITRDDQTFLLSENESIYIPLGAFHSLSNPGKIPLHIVEVQSGAYLGEDDIMRVEDRYGRLEERDVQEATVALSKPLDRRKADGDLMKVAANGKHAAP